MSGNARETKRRSRSRGSDRARSNTNTGTTRRVRRRSVGPPERDESDPSNSPRESDPRARSEDPSSRPIPSAFSRTSPVPFAPRSFPISPPSLFLNAASQYRSSAASTYSRPPTRASVPKAGATRAARCSAATQLGHAPTLASVTVTVSARPGSVADARSADSTTRATARSDPTPTDPTPTPPPPPPTPPASPSSSSSSPFEERSGRSATRTIATSTSSQSPAPACAAGGASAPAATRRMRLASAGATGGVASPRRRAEFARVILGVGGAPSDAGVGPASDPNASNASPENTEPSDEKRASSSSSEEEPPPYTPPPSSDGSSTRSARGGSAVRSIHARCSSPNHAWPGHPGDPRENIFPARAPPPPPPPPPAPPAPPPPSAAAAYEYAYRSPFGGGLGLRR